MAQIKNKNQYPLKQIIVDDDFFVMSDSENEGKTVSASVSDLKQVFVGTPNTGESNTLTNAGTGGVSVAADPSKIGVALQVNSIGAASSKTDVTLDVANKQIKVDVVDATESQKGAVELAADGETAAGVVVQGNDSRLADSRNPSGTAGGDLTGTYPNPDVANDAITFAKMQNATADGVLVGSGESGSGSDYTEITPNDNLSISGTNLNVIGSGSTGDLQFKNSGGGLDSNSNINYDSDTDSLDVDTRLTTSELRETGIFNSYDFESGSLAGFTTSGDANWFATNTTSNSGTWSAQSGSIVDTQRSTIELNVSPTAALNVIDFAYQTSTEAEFDFLNFYIDNVLQDSFSGIQAWQPSKKYLIAAGTYTFKWEFLRNNNLSGGTNSVNIDDVFIREVESSTDLNGITIVNDAISFGGSVSFNDTVQGDLVVSGKGVFNNVALWNGNFSVLTNTFLGEGQGDTVSGFLGDNSGLGYAALPVLEDGQGNTASGINSGKDLTEGNYNTFDGVDAGRGIVDGDYNTISGRATSDWPSDMSNNVIQMDGQGNIAFRRNELNEHTIPLQTIATTVSGGDASIVTLGYLNSVISYDATVASTGASFTTFKAAYDSGARTIKAIGDFTEASDTVISESVLFTVDIGVTANFSSFNIQSSSNDVTFSKIGEGDILYASTVASKFFFDNGGNSNNTFIFNGGLFNNQSTASGCRITNAQNQDIRCWKINLPNLPDCGIRFETQNCFIRDTNFVGGGSSCYGAIYQLDGRVQDIDFTGTFDLTSGNFVLDKPNSTGELSNVNFSLSASPVNIRLYTLERLSNISSISGQSLNVLVDNSEATLTDLYLSGGELDLDDNAERLTLTRIKFVKFTNTFTSQQILTDCVIDPNTLQLDFFYSKLKGCRLSSTGDLTFNQFGNNIDTLTLPNGTLRIMGNKNTITSSSADTIIIGADLADPTVPPPTEVLGDQYYLDPGVGGPVDPAWDGNAKGTTVEFNGVIWVVINTPTDTVCIGNRTTSGSIIDNGNNTGITNTSFL